MLCCLHVKSDHLSSGSESHDGTQSPVKYLSAFLSLFLFVTTHGTHTETLLLSDFIVLQSSTCQNEPQMRHSVFWLPSRLQADTQNQYKAQTSYNVVLVKCLFNDFTKHKDT